MKEFVKDVGIAALLVFITMQFVMPTRVIGTSMQPNFAEGDYLIVDKTAYRRTSPKVGDVVVFQSSLKNQDGENELLIKRVCAVAGDHIVITGGHVYVNGAEQDESFTKDGTTDGEIDTVVPDGCVFCMGDNRLASIDSRYSSVGFVSIDSIKGRVVFRLLPIHSFGKVSEIGDALQSEAVDAGETQS